MFKSLFRIGVHNELDSYKRVKIILSNQVAFIVVFITMVYGFTSFIYFPAIFEYYILACCITLTCILFNLLHLYTLSRFIISVLPTLTGTMSFAAVSSNNSDFNLEIAFTGIALSVAPFVLFDTREVWMRNISFTVCALLVIYCRYINEWIDLDVDASVLQNSFFRYFNSLVAVGAIFGFLAVLQSTNRRAENKNKELLADMEEKGREVEEKSKVLEATLHEVQKAREEDEKRSWAANGIAQLTTLMRKETDLDKLYSELISNIINYVKANQGGLYIVQGDSEDEKCLELAACYAYDRKKYIHQRFEKGEGLLGQCFMEKEKIFITSLPDDYVRITSGLGNATPRCLIIVPMKVNDEVEGLIELASFSVFMEHEIDFLEKLGENIGAVIRNNKNNERTRILLEESQLRTEQMRAQEEEMRQNMEELQATQEELLRKERIADV